MMSSRAFSPTFCHHILVYSFIAIYQTSSDQFLPKVIQLLLLGHHIDGSVFGNPGKARGGGF